MLAAQLLFITGGKDEKSVIHGHNINRPAGGKLKQLFNCKINDGPGNRDTRDRAEATTGGAGYALTTRITWTILTWGMVRAGSLQYTDGRAQGVLCLIKGGGKDLLTEGLVVLEAFERFLGSTLM